MPSPRRATFCRSVARKRAWPGAPPAIQSRAMPELPEVETVCRLIRHALQGQRIAKVEVARDAIVFAGFTAKAVEQALLGRTVRAVGRRGKFFWLSLGGEGPTVFAHLGMSGWVREVGLEGTR